MNDAQQPQIIRSYQKDSHYRAYLKSLFTDVANSLPGMKIWLKWTKEIDLGADLLYYSLTTLAGYQTLGEEYVNILQINLDKRSIPSKYKRAMMIALEILIPYLLDRLVSIVAHKLRTDGTLFTFPKRKLADVMDSMKNVINFLHKYNLTLFYVGGIFYSLAKRLLGIYYVQVRSFSGNQKSKSYYILGVLMLLQLIITSIHRFYKVWASVRGPNSNRLSCGNFLKNFLLYSEENDTEGPHRDCTEKHRDEKTLDTFQTCGLCQGSITDITSTNCGHLFCWKCIVGWCETKPECPICRAQIIPSKLILLQNFN